MQLTLRIALATIFIGRAWAQLPPVPGTPIPVIVDTDICEFVDDPWDIQVAIGLQKAGYLNIIAGTTITSVPQAGEMTETFYKYSRIFPLIGTNQTGAIGATDRYCAQASAAIGIVNKPVLSDYATALTVLRTALAAAANGSVVIICTGPLTNISTLLQSPADGISGLTGSALVAAKVKFITVSGGIWPSGTEADFAIDPVSASYVYANSPVPIYSSDAHLYLGQFIFSLTPSVTPTYQTTYYFSVNDPTDWFGTAGSEGWIAAVLEAISTTANGYYNTLSTNGSVVVNSSTGANVWSSSPMNNQYYFEQSADPTTLLNSFLFANYGASAGTRGIATMRGNATIR